MTDLQDSRHSRLRGALRSALPIAAASAIVCYLALSVIATPDTARRFALAALFVTALPLVIRTLDAAMKGHYATDAIASISIITALVMKQPLPGMIIVLMQSGGESLERMAQRRAGRELSILEKAAPRVARKWTGSTWEEVPINDIFPGHRVLVEPGGIVPVDGTVADGEGSVETAMITGEPMPLRVAPGSPLLSGYVNGTTPLLMDATAAAAESNYARIVRMVQFAQQHKAPIQRLADRYATWFTPLVLSVAATTFALTRDMHRVLAILVIATPCPLILATPIAIIAGINSGARARILFHNGVALETLARLRAVLFDKTGTLTAGRPVVTDIIATADVDRATLLSRVGSIETFSSHPIAREISEYAKAQGATALRVSSRVETAGRGIRGTVDGKDVAVGSRSWLESMGIPLTDEPGAGRSDEMRSWIAQDQRIVGYVRYCDVPRPDLIGVVDRLRDLGIRHIEILSGDEEAAVQRLASAIRADQAHARLRPADKLEHLKRVSREFGVTAMVGDGTNDAPALAAADVGIAITPRGGGVAAETADVVLLGDDLSRILNAIAIAKRTIRLARQSIIAGLSLSALGMLFAAAGLLPAVPAAALQEVIDLFVIANVLRIPAGHRAL